MQGTHAAARVRDLASPPLLHPHPTPCCTAHTPTCMHQRGYAASRATAAASSILLQVQMLPLNEQHCPTNCTVLTAWNPVNYLLLRIDCDPLAGSFAAICAAPSLAGAPALRGRSLTTISKAPTAVRCCPSAENAKKLQNAPPCAALKSKKALIPLTRAFIKHASVAHAPFLPLLCAQQRNM